MFEKTASATISLVCALALAGCTHTGTSPAPAPAGPEGGHQSGHQGPTPAAGEGQGPAGEPAAGKVAIRPSAPRRYVVKKGDTLWDIAAMFLHEPWYWPEIWHANPEIRNPHLIYPGDVLTLYYADGRPQVQVSGGPRTGGGHSTQKLHPRVRVEPLEDAQRLLPIQAVQQLIFEPHVLTHKQIEASPYILSGEDYRLIFASGDIVYVRNLDQSHADTHYSVVRPGAPLRHHRSGELLGYAMDPVGVVRILAGGRPATGRLLEVKREALPGDRLLRHEAEHANQDFMPHAPKHEVDGAVILLFDAISMIGQLQVAVVDLGTRDGIDRGTVLRTFKTGPVVYDPMSPTGESPKIKLPNEPAALLMVFSTFEKLSYALVMEAARPVQVGDTIHSPLRSGSAGDQDPT